MMSLNIDESQRFCQVVKLKASSIIPTIYIYMIFVIWLIYLLVTVHLDLAVAGPYDFTYLTTTFVHQNCHLHC